MNRYKIKKIVLQGEKLINFLLGSLLFINIYKKLRVLTLFIYLFIFIHLNFESFL